MNSHFEVPTVKQAKNEYFITVNKNQSSKNFLDRCEEQESTVNTSKALIHPAKSKSSPIRSRNLLMIKRSHIVDRSKKYAKIKLFTG